MSEIGANVTIIDNLSSGKEEYIKNFSNVTLIKSELTDKKSLPGLVKDKEYVIDLAALPFIPDSYYIPRKFFDVNVNATIDLAIAVIKKNQQNDLFIFLLVKFMDLLDIFQWMKITLQSLNLHML